MKFKYFFVCICSVVLVNYALANEPIRLSEPVFVSELDETFGAIIDEDVKLVTMADILNSTEEFLQKPFRVVLKIHQVCQKKGCFFITKINDGYMRVAFKDYGFFIPTDATGKTVTLLGKLIKKTRTETEAKHLNEDINNPEVDLNPGTVFEILADAVLVPRNS